MIWWPEEVPTLTSINAKSGATITLRPMRPTDADNIYRAVQDPLIPKFTTVPSEYPIDLAISFAGPRSAASFANKTELVFVIESNEIVGKRIAGITAEENAGVTSHGSASVISDAIGGVASGAISGVASDGFAGVISLHTIDIGNHRAEIGYWLAREARGLGIGSTAAEVITEYGLMTMGFRRINGLVDVRNEASKKLLLKAGYEFDCVLRQYVTRRDGSQLDMALFSATR